MKRRSSFLALTLAIILLLSAVPSIKSEAAFSNNPYAAWISIFDPDYYISNDAAAAAYASGDINRLWQYFVNIGIPKGDQASAEFNVFTYAKNYPELVQTFGSNIIQYYIHYATSGKAAGLNARTLNSASQLISNDPPKNLLDCLVTQNDYNYIKIVNDGTDNFGNRYTSPLIEFGARYEAGKIVFTQVSGYKYLRGTIVGSLDWWDTDVNFTVKIYSGNNLVYSSPVIEKYTAPINFDVAINNPTHVRVEIVSNEWDCRNRLLVTNIILHN